MPDIDTITAFLATHARLLDRRRAELALGDGSAAAALAALSGYRNSDGGYGWGLEPDLRAPSSQPAGALHAFEVFEEIAPVTDPLARALCDWLEANSLPSGALPFSLPGADYPGSGIWWARADPSEPSLQITAAVAGVAHRVARQDRAVAEHPWLAQATSWCLDAIAELQNTNQAIQLMFVLQLLDELNDSSPRAAAELERLVDMLPASATLRVPGGAEEEALRPLDLSPWPDRPLRALLDPQVIRDDLDRLEAAQAPDGGWHVDFAKWSEAGTLEWSGYATVRALRVLIAHDRLRIASAG